MEILDQRGRRSVGSFIKFNKGMLKQPIHVKLWLLLLLAANLIVPLFYLQRLESQVVLTVFLASFAFTVVITAYAGYSRLLGLGHVFWFPLLYFLWTRLDQSPEGDFFGLWIRALMVLNATSLIIDVVDVVRYIAGDRQETVPNL